MCPKWDNGAANIWVDDRLVGQSDTHYFDGYSQFEVYDCHGILITTVKTDSVWDTFVNGLRFDYSTGMFSSNGTLIVFVEGDTFFADDLQFYDALTGKLLGEAYRDTVFEITPEWEFTIYDADHPGMKPVIMGGLTSYITYREDDKMDGCNQYFWVVSIMVLAVPTLPILGLVAVLVYVTGNTLWRQC